MSAYVVVETRPAWAETVCGATRCGTIIPEGAPVVTVYHERRFIRDPNGPTVEARLCVRCTERLGANARPIVPTSHFTKYEPFMYRGKPVPAF